MLIDKKLGTQFYIQISDYIRKEIADGVYSNGEMMPSELEMQKKFDVSRITIRNAYKVLIDEGILKSIKGKGTFVNILEEGDWVSMNSFTKDVLKRGHVPSTKIIDFEVIEASEYVASNLKVKTGTKCYYFNRLRSIDNKAVWLTKTYVLCDIAEGLTAEHFSRKGAAQSIFFVLETNFGVQFRPGPTMSIENHVSDEDANLLNIDRNEPVICAALVVMDETGRNVMYENTVFDQSITYKPVGK
jgi:DNA-binding GntR family transcriptional regulator